MNRRTLLAALGGLSAFGFLGYLINEMRLSLPVIIRVENVTDVDRNVTITAHELETDRQTFDASFSVPTDSTATPGRLSNSDLYVEITLMEPPDETEPDEEPGVAAVEETLIGDSTQRINVTITDDGLDVDIDYR